jgi:hypothetical protein
MVIERPCTQPEAPISTFTVRVLESSLVSARRSQVAAQGYCTTNPDYQSDYVTSKGSRLYRSRTCTGIQDITFSRDKGQRGTADGPEYQFVAKMWLRPSAGILSNLVHVYRRDFARQARLSTLRTRKRMSEEAGVVQHWRNPDRIESSSSIRLFCT